MMNLWEVPPASADDVQKNAITDTLDSFSPQLYSAFGTPNR